MVCKEIETTKKVKYSFGDSAKPQSRGVSWVLRLGDLLQSTSAQRLKPATDAGTFIHDIWWENAHDYWSCESKAPPCG